MAPNNTRLAAFQAGIEGSGSADVTDAVLVPNACNEAFDDAFFVYGDLPCGGSLELDVDLLIRHGWPSLLCLHHKRQGAPLQATIRKSSQGFT